MDGTGNAACDHADGEFLGGGGSALYYRCGACGEALVLQGGKVWGFRAVPGPG